MVWQKNVLFVKAQLIFAGPKVSTLFYLYISENVNSMLQKHIPRVSRALVKVLTHVDNLQSVAEYLEVLGRIHHKIGIQVQLYTKLGIGTYIGQSQLDEIHFQDFELTLLAPHFMASATRYIPSELRDRRTQGTFLNTSFDEICSSDDYIRFLRPFCSG